MFSSKYVPIKNRIPFSKFSLSEQLSSNSASKCFFLKNLRNQTYLYLVSIVILSFSTRYSEYASRRTFERTSSLRKLNGTDNQPLLRLCDVILVTPPTPMKRSTLFLSPTLISLNLTSPVIGECVRKLKRYIRIAGAKVSDNRVSKQDNNKNV